MMMFHHSGHSAAGGRNQKPRKINHKDRKDHKEENEGRVFVAFS
jgi:hypothetical protein